MQMGLAALQFCFAYPGGHACAALQSEVASGNFGFFAM